MDERKEVSTVEVAILVLMVIGLLLQALAIWLDHRRK